MKIAIASDHGGFHLKDIIKKYLDELDYEYEDFGTTNEKSVDYSDYALKVAEAVSENKFDKGILICGTGIGMSIAANKVEGIRAAVYYGGPLDIVRLSRSHNDANILSLGARFLKDEEAKEAVKTWLETPFSNEERHKRRIEKIRNIETDKSVNLTAHAT